jgi:hypothetical protein
MNAMKAVSVETAESERSLCFVVRLDYESQTVPDALSMLDDRDTAEFAALSDLAFTATDPDVRDHAALALKALRRRIHSQNLQPSVR